MFTQGRTILVAALVLAALGAGPAMAKPGGAGPGVTEAIEALEDRVDDIVDLTPGGVSGCAAGEIAKSDGSNNWTCQPDDDTLGAIPSCGAGQIPKFVGGTTWTCVADDDTLGGVTGCSAGAVAKSLGSDTWGCAADNIGTDFDTLGDLNCSTGQIAKFDTTNGWECKADNAGGGGSPFTLFDSAGPPVPVGTVVGIQVGQGVDFSLTVSTLLTNTHIPTAVGSPEKIVLPVIDGALANISAVFWTLDACMGTPWIPADAGFLDTILPATVVQGQLYVAKNKTVIGSMPFKSSSFAVDVAPCFETDMSFTNVVEANPGIAVSTLFTGVIVLGGGP